VPETVSGTCQSDTAQPRTRGCSKHSPGNKALRCMRPILHPRAACVVGHRAKDELTTASGCRQARATASLAPTPSQCGQFRPSFSPGPRPNGSMMSGSALHQRSNPTRWASGGGHGGECFARKRHWVEKPSTVWGQALFAVRAPPGRPSLWRRFACRSAVAQRARGRMLLRAARSGRGRDDLRGRSPSRGGPHGIPTTGSCWSTPFASDDAGISRGARSA